MPAKKIVSLQAAHAGVQGDDERVWGHIIRLQKKVVGVQGLVGGVQLRPVRLQKKLDAYKLPWQAYKKSWRRTGRS